MKNILKRLSLFTSSRHNPKGFTIIEVLVVFSLIAIVTSLSIAGFSSYGKVQTFEQSSADVSTVLVVARSRSLSQVKPCVSNETLNGYLVTIAPGGSTYKVDAVCAGVPSV